MLKRLLSTLTRKKGASPTEATAPLEAPPADEPSITVYDAFGRELQITRSEWREKMLLPNLEKQQDNAGELYALIVSALNDDFAPDLIGAAQRLVEIDDLPERSHTIQGIVLMKNGLLDAAEASLRTGIQKVGETAVLLTNLAKVFAERGDASRAHDILWQAIQADPNQDNGLLWWAAIERERDGEAGYLQALRTIAALPGSWRAQLWLARHHLEANEVHAARRLYEEVLAGAQFDSESLMMISGDLGNHDQVDLILDLVAPVYDPSRHDPRAGLNLLQACVQLGRIAEGEALLAGLYALKLAPYKQHLDHFADAFQKARAAASAPKPIDPEQIKAITLALTRPIWHYGLSNPDWLFAQKPKTSPEIGFFAFSKMMDNTEHAEEQREDDIGRLTRALPLYLAEAVYYWTEFSATTYITVVEGGGPVVTGGQSDGQALFDIVPAELEFFVTGEIGRANQGETAHWRISLSLWDCHTRSELASEGGEADDAGLGALVLRLEKNLLARIGQARSQAFDAFYLRPTEEVLPVYLSELGQTLMLTLAANQYLPKSSLWGERAMLDWPLTMALHWPTVSAPKLMYFSGLGKAHAYQSDALPEYKEKSLQLLREASQAQDPSARLAPLVWKIFGMAEQLAAHRAKLPADAQPAYRAWLERIAE